MRNTQVFIICSALIASAPLSAIAAAPPKLSVDPRTVAAAKQLQAPIKLVTVFSDRARIRRRGRFPGAGGPRLYRLPDLPGAIDLPSVRVTANKGRIVRVEANPVERERFEIAQVREAIDRLEALQLQLREKEIALSEESDVLNFLRSIRPAKMVSEQEREGRRALTVDTRAWFSSQDFLEKRSRRHQARIAALQLEKRALTKERTKLVAEVQKRNLGGFSQRVVEVTVVTDSAGGTFELEYFVKGASWKPAYELDFDPGRAKLVLRTAATVQQATGEDWTGVDLELSTAIPGRGISLPELLTWTLGESRDFVIRPRPKKALPRAQRYPLPSPGMTLEDEARLAEADLLRARMTFALGDPNVAYKQKTVVDFSDSTIEGDLARPDGAYLLGRQKADYNNRDKRPKRASSPRPRPPSQAPAAPSVSMDDAMVEELSVTSAGASSSRSGRRRKRESFQKKALALFDAPPPAPPRFTDPYLPAVSAGGFDYVFKAQTKETVPSTGETLRIALATRKYAAETVYEASPGLSTVAYTKARVKNGSNLPILRGPTTIFSGGRFVAQGEIQTTGPGGTLDFGLGADENVRLIRKVVPQTETKGFISKDDVTAYVTTIEIGNYKKKPISIEIVDQIPKARHEDVEVKFLSSSPSLRFPPSSQGILRWILDVPPGKTKKVVFKYSITRPRDWQLQQQ